MRPPRESRWRRHRRDRSEHQVESDPAVSGNEAATAAEVEELRNEIAELRQEADELKYRLKESEARLETVEDAGSERARILDTLLEWCQEQETVLGKHREVVAAMGAAARLVEEDLFAADLDPLRPPPRVPPVD